jgi:hypothetical protein
MPVVCGQLDITKISEDNLIAVSGYGAWVRFDVDEKIYEIAGYPYGYVVIKFDAPCWTTPCDADSTALVANSFLMISTSLNNTILKSGSENANGSSESDLPGSGLPSQLVCGVDVSLLRNAQKTVDALQTNEKGFQAAAIRPNACVIPMKSNVFSYGPWASTNFATTYGGAEISVNNDLSPWLFGSISSMNIAGQELANTSLVGLSAAEKGSVTVLGLPAYSIGSALTAGPNLSNISTTFGSAGCTTSYEFSTFTPKFGQVSRAIIEKYKNIVKIRNEQLRFLRQNQILNNKIALKRSFNQTVSSNTRGDSYQSISDKNSLSRILVGEIFDYQKTLNNDTGQRTICGISTLSKSVLEMRDDSYDKKSFMSLDGLYGPVSINGGNSSGALPRFISLPNIYGVPSGLGWTISPNPPVITSANEAARVKDTGLAMDINDVDETVSITKNYLNPLANSGAIPYHDGNSAGHCIDIVGRGTGLTDGGLNTNFYRPDDDDKYSSDYRFLAMRGPIVLHSWGYDTDGKPVPNEIDNENLIKISGAYQYNGLTNRFLTDWLQKPSTWPVAPIDLRLDRERGVWVSPKEHKIVTLELLETLNPFGNAVAKLISSKSGVNYNKDLSDEDGDPIQDSNKLVIVTDRLGITAEINSLNYAYFDTFSSKYLLVGGGGSAGISVGYAEGLWPIDSTKTVYLAEVNTNDELEKSDTAVIVYNPIQDTGKSSEYKIIFFKYNGLYLLLNAGGCAN